MVKPDCENSVAFTGRVRIINDRDVKSRVLSVPGEAKEILASNWPAFGINRIIVSAVDSCWAIGNNSLAVTHGKIAVMRQNIRKNEHFGFTSIRRICKFYSPHRRYRIWYIFRITGNESFDTHLKIHRVICSMMGADAPIPPIAMTVAAPKGAPRRLQLPFFFTNLLAQRGPVEHCLGPGSLFKELKSGGHGGMPPWVAFPFGGERGSCS